MRLSRLTVASCLVGFILQGCYAADSDEQYSFQVSPARLIQMSMPVGGLERYQELRTQVLAHSRVVVGPKTKNPRISANGLDPGIMGALTDQRAYLLARGGVIRASSGGAGGLLTNQGGTLLSASATNSGMLSHTGAANTPQRAQTKASCAVPAVRSVNGKGAGVIFTPVEPDNHYRIEGCGFGAIPGTVRLQAGLRSLQVGNRTPPISLQLEGTSSWSDDAIDVRLDTSLSGIADFPADLVVQLANGHELPLPGCLFVAARGEPQLLKTIPASWVRLDATFTSARPIGQLEYVSPPAASEEIPFDAVGSSALVVRSDPDVFSVGRDMYDFSQLAPGWVVESVQLDEFVVACPGEEKSQESKGNWSTTWEMHGFSVAWARQTCSSAIPPVFKFNFNSSQYSAKVWVVGPAGTEPLRRGL